MNNYKSNYGLLKAVSILPTAVFISSFSLTALAETAPQPHKVTETITVTANRVEQPSTELSSSISVVSSQEIEDVSAVHISELLYRVPSAWVVRGNGQEHLTAIRSPVLTGAGSCGSFYLAEDGIPVRPTGFCNVNQLFDLNTEQAGRIEVLRGPGTDMHGSDAVHGVINVLSRNPVGLEEAGELEVALEAGPDDYGRIKLSASESFDRFTTRINLNGASDGGYQDNSGFDQQKLTARLDYHGDTWSSYTLFSANNLNQETAGYVVGTDAYKDKELRKQNSNPEAFRDTQSFRWQTRFEGQFANDAVFIVTPYARYSEMEFLMHFLPGQPTEENGQKSVGIQSSFHSPINSTTEFTSGFDIELTQAYLQQTQDAPFLWFTPAGKQYDYEVDAMLLAGFTSVNFQVTDKLNLSVGGRLESLEYDYNNQMISGNTDENGIDCVNVNSGATGCRYTRPEDREDDFENISVNGGLVYEYSPSHIYSARINHGYRAPQATELYRLQAGQLIAELDSEQVDSVEVGVKGVVQGLAQSFSYDLTAYYMEKDNVIFQSSDRQNLDNGETRHQGLEYLLSLQLNDHWNVSASGALSRHRYANNVTAPASNTVLGTKGNDMVSAPRNLSSVRLAWTPSPRDRVELEWVSMGHYYTDLANVHSYDGHDLLNLRVQKSISEAVAVGLRIKNIADKYYAERADFSGFAGDRYFVGQPRSLFADVKLKF